MGRGEGRIGERNMGMVEGYGDGGGKHGEMEYGEGGGEIWGGEIWGGEDGGDGDGDVRYGDGERRGEDGGGGCEKVDRRHGEVGKWDGGKEGYTIAMVWLHQSPVMLGYGFTANAMLCLLHYVVILGLMLCFAMFILSLGKQGFGGCAPNKLKSSAEGRFCK